MTSVNDAPVASAQTLSTPMNTPVSITLAGLDADMDDVTFTIAGEPSHGGISGSAPQLTYTPDQDFAGTDSFTYSVSDGGGGSTPPQSSGCSSTGGKEGFLALLGLAFCLGASRRRRPSRS